VRPQFALITMSPTPCRDLRPRKPASRSLYACRRSGTNLAIREGPGHPRGSSEARVEASFRFRLRPRERLRLDSKGRQSRDGGSSSTREPQRSTRTSASTKGLPPVLERQLRRHRERLARGARDHSAQFSFGRRPAPSFTRRRDSSAPRSGERASTTSSCIGRREDPQHLAKRCESCPPPALGHAGRSFRLRSGTYACTSGPLLGRGRGAITAISSVRAASGSAKGVG
jgi:hypothetical protein